jgi:hypothetical protein
LKTAKSELADFKRFDPLFVTKSSIAKKGPLGQNHPVYSHLTPFWLKKRRVGPKKQNTRSYRDFSGIGGKKRPPEISFEK